MTCRFISEGKESSNHTNFEEKALEARKNSKCKDCQMGLCLTRSGSSKAQHGETGEWKEVKPVHVTQGQGKVKAWVALFSVC